MTKKNKKQTFYSVMEFEREYLPKSFEKRKAEQSLNVQSLGTILAKESLAKIRAQLAK